MPIHVAFQLHSAPLRLADLMFQFRQAFAELPDCAFVAHYIFGTALDFDSQFFDRTLSLADLRLKHVELMARNLRVQMLQLDHELFVAARLAGLALERTDLSLHFTNQVADAQ